MKIRTYNELRQLKTFAERYEYLKLAGQVGVETFGFDRIFNQMFYRSAEWQHIRSKVILRDNACDMGLEGFEIMDKIYIHHMNPVTIDDIKNATEFLLEPRYLICVSFQTHNAIHYGVRDVNDLMPKDPIVRYPNDQCPWRKL